jgi:flagellar FliL protein
MADAAGVAQDEVPAKSKKPLIMLVAAVLVAIGASVGGTLYFVQRSAPESVTAEEAPAEAAKAVYHSMRPPFVVNFITENKSRYLQADITLMSRDTGVIEAIIDHSPLVRSQILQYLSDQNFTQLRTDDGKEKTRVELKKILNEQLLAQAQVSGIESVLLTNFVLQ